MTTLTHADPLVACGSRPPVSAAAAVEAAEVSAALTAAVEEADGPPLPVVTPVVRVLRAVRARVRREGHALAAARGGTARVEVEPGGGRAALSAPETLRGHALSRELCVHEGCAHEHEYEDAAGNHDPKRLWRLLLSRTQLQVRLQVRRHFQEQGLSRREEAVIRRSEPLLSPSRRPP